jgi:hypothetical protein
MHNTVYYIQEYVSPNFSGQHQSCLPEPIKEKVNVYLPSLRMKVPDHVYVLGHSYTCHTLIKYN